MQCRIDASIGLDEITSGLIRVKSAKLKVDSGASANPSDPERAGHIKTAQNR